MKNNNKTHRGQFIANYIKEQGIIKSSLVNKLVFSGKKRTYRTLLNKLSEPDLSVDDIISFSKVLNKNFLLDFPDVSQASIKKDPLIDEIKQALIFCKMIIKKKEVLEIDDKIAIEFVDKVIDKIK